MEDPKQIPHDADPRSVVIRRMDLPDSLVRAIRTSLQLVPFGIGSAIDTGYFGNIDEKRIARLETFIKQLADEVRSLTPQHAQASSEDMLAAFSTDEFAYIFEGVLKRVSVEVAQEKLDALRGVLVSMIVDEQTVAFEKQSSFLKSIDDTEGTHIRILQFLLGRDNTTGADPFISRSEICTMLGAESDADVSYVYFALDTLANREFIKSGPVPFRPDGTIDRPTQTFCITGLGTEFLDFIRRRP